MTVFDGLHDHRDCDDCADDNGDDDDGDDDDGSEYCGLYSSLLAMLMMRRTTLIVREGWVWRRE